MEGGRVSNVVKTTIGKEKGRGHSGVDVWRCEFGGNCGVVGISPRPWVGDASGC